MASKTIRYSLGMLVLCFAIVAAVPAFAGSSVIGSVAGSTNATIGGQPAINGSTIFSGDSLRVTDGMAFVTLGEGSRAVFGRNSQVSFLREGESITARLTSGSVSLFQPINEQNGMRVKFDNLTIGPAGGYKTLGEVAMLGDTVVVSTKEGIMNVAFANGKTTQVPAGKVLKLASSQRAPQAAAGSQHFGGNSNPVEWAALGAAGVAAVLAGVDISKADDAKTSADSAGAAANAATSAANAAASDATTAGSAASAAAAAASAAAANANSVGCALNQVANPTGTGVSPYTPPSGYTCPAY